MASRSSSDQSVACGNDLTSDRYDTDKQTIAFEGFNRTADTK